MNSENLVIGLLSSALIIKLFSSRNINWENEDAIEQLRILIRRYGKPSIKDYSTGGMAIWTKKQLKETCYERIELLDESVPHCVPKPHRDFLYTFINYEVPDDKVLDVISLSGSVSYDPLKKLLRARCGSEDANVATLYLCTAIGNNRISIDEIQDKELYKKTIMSLSSPQNTQIYYERLCSSIKNQPGNPKWTGFFPLAFPEGCYPNYDPSLNECGHTEEDHKSGKVVDHTLEHHKSDKSDKPIIESYGGDKSDKSDQEESSTI